MNPSNNINILGRLTDEVRVNNKGENTMATFSVAVDRAYKDKEGNRPADFINCIAYGKTAELIAQYFSKGRPIKIVGDLRNNNYEDRNGNKQYTYQVNVESFSFVPVDKEAAGNTQLNRQVQPQYQDAADPFAQTNDKVEISENDLPF